jgi:hypothetical protein
MKHKTIIGFIFMIVISVIVYGIVLPFLISYDSDFLVGVGVVGGITYTYLAVMYMAKLIKSLNQ